MTDFLVVLLGGTHLPSRQLIHLLDIGCEIQDTNLVSGRYSIACCTREGQY